MITLSAYAPKEFLLLPRILAVALCRKFMVIQVAPTSWAEPLVGTMPGVALYNSGPYPLTAADVLDKPIIHWKVESAVSINGTVVLVKKLLFVVAQSVRVRKAGLCLHSRYSS